MGDVRTDRVLTKKLFFQSTVPMFAALLGSIVTIFGILHSQTHRSLVRDQQICDLVQIDQLFEPYLTPDSKFRKRIDRAVADATRNTTCKPPVVPIPLPTPTPKHHPKAHPTPTPGATVYVPGPTTTTTTTVTAHPRPSHTRTTRPKQTCPNNNIPPQVCKMIPTPSPVPTPSIHLEGR